MSLSERSPRSLPVMHILQPQRYDGYQGENSIPARVSYMPVTHHAETGKEHNAVIRLADMWIDPYFDADAPKAATIIYIGGGDSDALASTGLAGYIRDAQQASLQKNTDAKWYARNIVTVSHPAGAPRTEKDVAATSMKRSAEIIYAALHDAIRKGFIKADNIVLMGSSAGGALTTELAAMMQIMPLMGRSCKQLILEEPAAMGEHEKIT